MMGWGNDDGWNCWGGGNIERSLFDRWFSFWEGNALTWETYFLDLAIDRRIIANVIIVVSLVATVHCRRVGCVGFSLP